MCFAFICVVLEHRRQGKNVDRSQSLPRSRGKGIVNRSASMVGQRFPQSRCCRDHVWTGSCASQRPGAGGCEENEREHGQMDVATDNYEMKGTDGIGTARRRKKMESEGKREGKGQPEINVKKGDGVRAPSRHCAGRAKLPPRVHVQLWFSTVPDWWTEIR